MATKRRTEISYLNILLCMFVMFIHVVSFAVSGFEVGTRNFNIALFPWRLVSFSVQGFILLSGVKLFLTGKDKKLYPVYLFSRIRTIIIPYIICFALYYVFYYYQYNYPLEKDFIVDLLIHGSLVYHLYFIVLLFQFDLLFPLWKRVINKCPPILVIPFCVIITSILEFNLPTMISVISPDYNFLYNDRTFTTYLCYWVIGCYIGKYYEQFTELLKKHFKTIFGIFIITLIPYVYFTYIAYNEIAYIPFMNQLHSLYSMCVVIFLYSITVRLPKHLPRLLKWIDYASFDIYLWHVLVLFTVNIYIEEHTVQSQFVAFAIRFAVVYGVTITACIIISQLRRLRKYLTEKLINKISPPIKAFLMKFWSPIGAKIKPVIDRISAFFGAIRAKLKKVK